MLGMMGNPELLHRAFENIVRNALAYSPLGGTVSIAGSRFGEEIVLEIADDGPGVPDPDLTAIFSPFVRSDTGVAAQGIGLGLAIASSVVRSHGGAIAAQNRAPSGLLIRIAFPVGADFTLSS